MKQQAKDFFIICERSVLCRKNLTANDKLILSLIRGYWNCGKEFTASNSYIAESLGITRRSVIRSIEKLEKLHFIRCEYSIINNGQDRKIIQYRNEPTIDKEEIKSTINGLMDYIKNYKN